MCCDVNETCGRGFGLKYLSSRIGSREHSRTRSDFLNLVDLTLDEWCDVICHSHQKWLTLNLRLCHAVMKDRCAGRIRNTVTVHQVTLAVVECMKRKVVHHAVGNDHKMVGRQ